MSYPKYLVMQINSPALSRLLLHYCSGHAQSSADMQNLFKQQKKVLAAQSQSAAAARAGSSEEVEYQTNSRLWLNIRGYIAKTCRDIGPFSFQR